MTSIDSVALEAAEAQAAADFYAAAFELGSRLEVRPSEAATDGFRGFTVSLVVSGPATADVLIASGLRAGATQLKPAKKSLWGYGGTLQAPDGAIWKVATSARNSAAPATRDIDQIVLLLGVDDLPASKRFYVERGLKVARSFARVYVEFDTGDIKLALYKRRALAKDAGVPPEGSGSHRITILSGAGPFTDPDGFAWEATGQPAAQQPGDRVAHAA